MLALLIALAFWLTNGFTEALKSFHVLYNEDYIFNSTDGLFIQEGDVFEIKQYSDSPERLSVAVYAIESNREGLTFSFLKGEENVEYVWNDSVANCDVTDSFDIKIVQPTTDKNGTVKISGNVMTMLQYMAEKSGAEKVSLGDNFSIKGDLFRMVITVGDEEISLDFSVQMEPLFIDTDKKSLVF